MIPLYRIPGYGPVYRFTQRWLHNRGYCVLAVQPRIDDRWRWHCSWCGHRVTESAIDRQLRVTRDDAERLALLDEKARTAGLPVDRP